MGREAQDGRVTAFIGCFKAVSMRDTLSLNNAREGHPPLRTLPHQQRFFSCTCFYHACFRTHARERKLGGFRERYGTRPICGPKPLRFDGGDWNVRVDDHLLPLPLFDLRGTGKNIVKGLGERWRKNCGGWYLHRSDINLIYPFFLGRVVLILWVRRE